MSAASIQPESTEDVAAVIDYCGEIYEVRADQEFLIGREADLCIDDNPYLHRRLVRISCHDGLWWLDNIGSRIAVTVADASGSMQARVGPGARIPLVFESAVVVFAAGPTTYEFSITVHGTTFRSYAAPAADTGEATVGEARFTPSQYLLILALCEPWLTQAGSGATDIPRNAEAAARLGWPITRFNRKLDNVADKLDRMGVPGMRGRPGSLATHRRVRLVEYAVAARLVSSSDLYLLDDEKRRNSTPDALTGKDRR